MRFLVERDSVEERKVTRVEEGARLSLGVHGLRQGGAVVNVGQALLQDLLCLLDGGAGLVRRRPH